MFGLCSQLSCMMKSPLKWQGRRMIVRRCKIDVLAAITYRKRCCDQQVAEAGPRSRLPPVSLCCAGICTQSVSSTLKSLKSSEGLYSKMTNQSTMTIQFLRTIQLQVSSIWYPAACIWPGSQKPDRQSAARPASSLATGS